MKRCRSCLTVNENRFQKCQACGKALPKRRKPKHMDALKQPYEVFRAINGGDNCGGCGREPNPTRRHDRDHDHVTGEPRGLLCPVCNRLLDSTVSGIRLQTRIHGLVAYLDRHAARLDERKAA